MEKWSKSIKMNNKTFLIVLLAVILSLAACTVSGGGQADTEPSLPPTDTPVQQPDDTADEITVPDGMLGMWYWLAFEDSADGVESHDIAVSDPSKYTLEFLADGTVKIQADCNSASSVVTIVDSALSFAPGPMTLAECEPGSLYSEFLAKLGDVATYVFDEDGDLVLNLKMDAGNMIFGREANVVTVLDGTSWTLVGQGSSDDLTAPLPGSEITLDFTDGQASGTAGCNRYFAGYTISDADKLQMGPAGSTEMACEEAIMQQEFAYLTALSGAESFTLDGESLTIHTGEGDLAFTAAQSLTLEGQPWGLSGIVQNDAVVSMAIDNQITAEFSGDQVAGSAGCNSYFASYEAADGSLTLGMIGSTMMSCDEETNQRETEFLTALGKAAGYSISRNTLTLTDAGGNALLSFYPVGADQG